MMKSAETNTKNKQVERLADALLSLETRDECLALFDDLFTTKEIDDISSRLEVATQLKAGNNYNDIAAATGASTATISRVSKCLSGNRGGYRTVLSRLDSASDGTILELSDLNKSERAAICAIVKSLRSGRKD